MFGFPACILVFFVFIVLISFYLGDIICFILFAWLFPFFFQTARGCAACERWCRLSILMNFTVNV